MATKTEKQLAYDAGRAAHTNPPELRTVEACPFSEGTEERTSWLEGFQSGFDEAPDPVTIQREVADAIKANDKVVGN